MYWQTLTNFFTKTVISLRLLTVLLISSQMCNGQQKREFYISASGSDRNEGTIGRPFLTITPALQKLKSLPDNDAVTIYYRAGYYALNSPVVIDAAITAGHTLNISNYGDEKVLISGGRRLDAGKILPLRDAAMLKRFPSAARNHIVETDLNEQGITNFGLRVPHGFAREVTAPLEVFFNQSPLVLARWPNAGTVSIGKVTDHGSQPRNGEKDNRGARFTYDFTRPAGWQHADDIWLYGVFAHSYADDNVPVASIDDAQKTIQLKQASYYGVFADEGGSNKLLRGYYFYNIPEELDSAGEWWLDNETHKLYFWPPAPVSSSVVDVSVLECPLLILSHVKNVTIKGIAFGFGRGPGVYASGTDHVTIDKCVFTDFGTKAISTSDPVVPSLSDGNGHEIKDRADNNGFVISSCIISNTGTGAISLNGGDRRSLTSAGNMVRDCDISNYSRINRASPPAIVLGGVGNSVIHCDIHDGSSAAIGYSGNDHQIAFNHIRKVAGEFSDIGAVYTGRDPSSTGNKILFNFFDSIQSQNGYAVAAVYLDDGSGGMDVSGNVFYRCGDAKRYGAIHINGGANNRFENNYFIECPKGFSNTVWDDQKWKTNMYRPDMIKRITRDVDIRSPLYASRYPYLKSFFDSTNGTPPRTNYITNSLLYHVDKLTTGVTTFTVINSVISNDREAFDNYDRKRFTLVKAPPALKQTPEWKAIPFAEIGRRK